MGAEVILCRSCLPGYTGVDSCSYSEGRAGQEKEGIWLDELGQGVGRAAGSQQPGASARAAVAPHLPSCGPRDSRALVVPRLQMSLKGACNLRVFSYEKMAAFEKMAMGTYFFITLLAKQCPHVLARAAW